MKQAYVWGFGSCLALFALGCGSSDSTPEDATPASGGTGGSGQLDSSNTTKSTYIADARITFSTT